MRFDNQSAAIPTLFRSRLQPFQCLFGAVKTRPQLICCILTPPHTRWPLPYFFGDYISHVSHARPYFSSHQGHQLLIPVASGRRGTFWVHPRVSSGGHPSSTPNYSEGILVFVSGFPGYILAPSRGFLRNREPWSHSPYSW